MSHECKTCQFEDVFLQAEERGIDNPYLCTKNAKGKKTLNGCRTVTNVERARIIIEGCPDWKEGAQEKGGSG